DREQGADDAFTQSDPHTHSLSILMLGMSAIADCSAASRASGQANIDLRDTPFSVAPSEFTQGGYNASGTSTYSANNQVVELTGGGYRGWTNPAPYIYNPFNNNGGFQLNLVYGTPSS